jgi:hypothetical protein
MRAEKRDTTLQRFRKYSSSSAREPAGFDEENRRRNQPFSAVFGARHRRGVFVRSFS